MTRATTFAPEETIADAWGQLERSKASGGPVLADGVLAGILTHTDIERVPPEMRATTAVVAAMTREPFTIAHDEGLDDALEDLAEKQISWMPVLDAEQHVVGVVTMASITRAYRAALTSGVRRLDAIAAGTALLEITVDADAPVAGKTLAAAHLPHGVLVVSLQRQGVAVVPRGDTQLRPGDVATVIADAKQEAQVRSYFGHPVAEPTPALTSP